MFVASDAEGVRPRRPKLLFADCRGWRQQREKVVVGVILDAALNIEDHGGL